MHAESALIPQQQGYFSQSTEIEPVSQDWTVLVPWFADPQNEEGTQVPVRALVRAAVRPRSFSIPVVSAYAILGDYVNKVPRIQSKQREASSTKATQAALGAAFAGVVVSGLLFGASTQRELIQLAAAAISALAYLIVWRRSA